MLMHVLTFRATCLINPFDSSVQMAGTVKTQRISDGFGLLKRSVYLYYLCQGDYAFEWVCLYACFFCVCNYSKTIKHIFLKFMYE